MRALILTQDRDLVLTELDRPRVKDARDVLVRVHQTGVCGTDRSVLVGKFAAEPGVVMGHETVGTVVETGPDVTGLTAGDRVIANPTLYCGRCSRCLRGQTNFCHDKTGNEIGIDRHGSYADYILLEDRFFHVIPAGVSFDRAVLTEPLACVLNNLEAANSIPGDAVTVVGAGPIGLMCAITARHLGSPVTLIERDDFRRGQAAELIGEFFASGITVVSADSIHTLDRAPTVIDTVGNQLDTAMRLADDAGTVVAMGYDSRAETTIRPLELLQRQLRLVGAGDFRGPHFPRAVQMAAGLPLEKLISHRFSLESHAEALAVLAPSGSSGYSGLKVVIYSEETS